MAVLYIIGTPIGNLGDLTFRAAETFKSADLVACEDTRITLKILNHLGIRVPLLSCRAQNEEKAADKVIAALDQGKTVIYASDAGTPGLSDPGRILAAKAIIAGHEVIPIPGVSAFNTIVSIAGTNDKTVIFEGFLSPKAGRRKSRLKELFATGWAFVLYESPFRICGLLKDIADIDNMRYICVGREMTKLHEEYKRGPVEDVLAFFAQKKHQKGEFTVYISGHNRK